MIGILEKGLLLLKDNPSGHKVQMVRSRDAETLIVSVDLQNI
jgi:hypothetical protein